MAWADDTKYTGLLLLTEAPRIWGTEARQPGVACQRRWWRRPGPSTCQPRLNAYSNSVGEGPGFQSLE